MRRLSRILVITVMALTGLKAANEPEWSTADRGIRGRLIVLAPKKENPFCKVMLELENVRDLMADFNIPIDKAHIDWSVVDADGKLLPPIDGGAYDEYGAPREIVVPYDGSIKFRISHQGLAYSPGRDTAIIDMGSFEKAWSIPNDGKSYYLKGILSLPVKDRSDLPSGDWNGTLVLPKVRIPTEAK